MSDYGGGVNVWEDRISVFTPAQRFHGLYLILSHARTHINTHTHKCLTLTGLNQTLKTSNYINT